MSIILYISNIDIIFSTGIQLIIELLPFASICTSCKLCRRSSVFPPKGKQAEHEDTCNALLKPLSQIQSSNANKAISVSKRRAKSTSTFMPGRMSQSPNSHRSNSTPPAPPGSHDLGSVSHCPLGWWDGGMSKNQTLGSGTCNRSFSIRREGDSSQACTWLKHLPSTVRFQGATTELQTSWQS